MRKQATFFLHSNQNSDGDLNVSEQILFYHSQELTRADVDDILRDLSFTPNATTLVLNNNQLGDEGVRLLVEGLKQYPKINHLALSNNQLTDKACEYIGQLSQLETLDLSNNCITDTGVLML